MNMRILSVIGAAGLVVGASLPAAAVPKAETKILPKETFTGVESITLPYTAPYQLPGALTLPMDVVVVKDTSLTDDYPITTKFGIGSDIKEWGAAVKKCETSRPKLVRMVGSDAVPFVIEGDEGNVVLNANGRAVCTNF